MILEEENDRLRANTKRSIEVLEMFLDERARLRLLLQEAGEAMSILDRAGHRDGQPAEPDDPTSVEEAEGYGLSRGLWAAANTIRPVLAKIKAELEQTT